jgi:hypothetical protein
MFSAFHIKNSGVIDGSIGKHSCLFCRLKKKKCDRKLPKCSRCNQYKQECEPFERSVDYSKFSIAITKFNQDDNNTVSINNKGN